MILLDTNMVIYASSPGSPFHAWARDIIATAVGGEGAALNSIGLAELCVGAENPAAVAFTLESWGVTLVDTPWLAAETAAAAYASYRRHSSKTRPATPLPDFFIGAHARVTGWRLATADAGRFRGYFPEVELILPGLAPAVE
jgi:predicted nucleic acid-binding protein